MAMSRPHHPPAVPLSSPQAGSILREPLRLSQATGQEVREHSIDLLDHVTCELPGNNKPSSVSREPQCLSCHVTFALRDEQVTHYRLDWHRYNLKRKLKGLSHVTQEEFERISGDLSSISGSESDSEGPEESSAAEATPPDSTLSSGSPFIYFRSGEDPTLYSVYKALLHGGKGPASHASLTSSILSLSQPQLWIVLMRAGGHFAGAVFRGSSVLAHKTFHRYTVRAKRGTAQSARDSQSGGHGPRSAGASLRRYNEAALEQEIHELIASWSAYVEEASTIFIRTSKRNQSIFVGARKSPFSKDDPRIRGIPFVTRRPTLKEVKRVQSHLASIFIGSDPNVVSMATSTPNRAAERNEREREKREEEKQEAEGREGGRGAVGVGSGDGDGGCDSGVGEEGEVEVEKRKPKSKRNKNKKKPEKVKPETLPPDVRRLLRVCEVGRGEGEEGEEDLVKVLQDMNLSQVYDQEERVLGSGSVEEIPAGQDSSGQASSCSGQASSGHTGSGESMTPPAGVLNILHGGTSPLHVASACGHAELVMILLQHGADPALRDSSGQLPYLVAKEKSVRDSFRRFMAQHPSAYDYTAAQIPSPLTEEMERERRERVAERRREKKRAKKQKEKEHKVEREEEKVVEEQRRAESGISEREKRALAAERRLVQQQPQDISVQRAGVCSFCGQSLAGRVPFHRLDYKYCSMPCVREHRTCLAAPT